MLDGLASARAAIASVPAEKAELVRIDALTATLTSSPKNFEDMLLRPGLLREDVLGLLNDEPLAQGSTVSQRSTRPYEKRGKNQ
jgi:hypothetical protein